MAGLGCTRREDSWGGPLSFRAFHLLVAVSLLFAAGWSHGASGGDEMALRQLENGNRLARDGKLTQAVAAWMDLASRYPDSPAAPQALEKLGESSYPVADFLHRGKVSTADLARARGFFEKISTDYRTAPQAPAALFRLGLIFSDPAAAFYDLDEAYARFSAVTTLYPESEHVHASLYGMADILVSQGAWKRALVPLSRLLSRWPQGPYGGQAWFLSGLALARQGRLEAAARMFQGLRDRFPESPQATRARDSNTHLMRLMSLQARPAMKAYGRFTYLTPRLSPDWRLRSARSLFVGPGNHLWLADFRSGAVHLLGLDGAAGKRMELPHPTAVWEDSAGVVIGAGGAVVVNGRRIELADRDGRRFTGEIGFVARDRRLRLLVWEVKEAALRRFTATGKFDKVIFSAGPGGIEAVAASPDGDLFILDGRQRQVTVLSAAGSKRVISLSLAASLRRPSHLAVDFMGHLFVMDRSSRTIGVFDPSGRVLASVSSGKTAADPFPRPEAMTVDQRGEIIIYDGRRDGLVIVK